jgi:small subunit ribosomal protein S24e
MEIEIDSKRNNPLLNRTEVYFTVKHQGEGTPNRELIRSELAEKLNVKKENIVVNTVQSSFGNQEVTGYAKIYSSLAKSKDLERDYVLRRNKLMEPGQKDKKKAEEKPAEAPKEEGATEPPAEPEQKEDQPTEESPVEETPKEEEKPEAPPAEPSEQKEEQPPVEEPEKPKEQPADEPPKEEAEKKPDKPDE